MAKSLSICLLFWLIMSIISINQVYGYARITSVKIYAPSQVKVGQEAPVHVLVQTGNNRVEYVHDVEILLILPTNVNLTSGSNPYFIGEMGPGPAEVWIRDWNVIFEKPGAYTLVVNASCVDTQFIHRWMINSTTVEVYDYPHVEFNYTPSNPVYVNQTITFNATKSYAQGPGREIVSYQWDFGDGANVTSNTPITNHTYENPGNFTVYLEITDNKGLSTKISANITVNMLGDLNSDGEVNIKDISIVAFSYGSGMGDQRWNSKADINQDGTIDIRDVAIVAKEYGKKI